MDAQIRRCEVANRTQPNLVHIIYICGGRYRFPNILFFVVIDIPRVELDRTGIASSVTDGADETG